MGTDKWLHDYYGKDFDVLNPEVVLQGERFAVVRLRRVLPNMISSVGYVLINKHGSHSSSPHTSLHDGVMTPEVLDRVKKALENAELK